MKRILGVMCLTAAACAMASAQTPEAALSFEVASLKPAAPQTDGMMRRMIGGGPGTRDPGTLTYENVPLKTMLTLAYDLKDFQVEGPDWIGTEGFDVVAKMKAGTTKEEMRQMLQTLLSERFKLTLHRETKQLPVFALVVGKGGLKMQKVEIPDTPPKPDGPEGGRGGLSDMPRGRPDGPPPPMKSGPGVRMMVSPNGIQMAGYMTMEQLATGLGRSMDRPVLDQTQLSGTYDVNITWMPDEMPEMGGRGGMPPPGAGAGGPPGGMTGGTPGRGNDAARSNEPVATLPQALQDTLGLKLETRKSPAEILVVDHAEKTPVEN